MDNFLESFNRSKLLINYDVSKTLSENQVKEQYYPINVSGPHNQVNQASPLYHWMKTWDVHDWFSLVQIVLMFLGLFTMGTTSIIAMALGAASDVVEAGIFYFKDEDPYMASVMLILSLLGIDDLMKIPTVKKYGIDGTKQLIKKGKEDVARLTKEEIEDLKKLGQYIGSRSQEFIPLIKKAIKSQVTKYLSKKSLKWLLNLLIVLNKTKKPLLVAGTWIAFDHFYIYVFRDDIKKMKLRNENTFIQIVKYVEMLLSGKEIDKEQFVRDNIPMDSTTLDNNLYKVDTTKVDTEQTFDSLLRVNGIL